MPEVPQQPSPENEPGLENLARAIVLLVMTVMAALTALTHFSQVIGLPFRTYAVAGTCVALVIVCVAIAYLPFTRMLHFLAKYFTYHEVRWNDSPMAGNEKMQKEVIALLNQSVTWAAPHLNADGKKNWVDIATEENK